VKPQSNFITQGTVKSEFREGNSTLQLEVLPGNSTFPPPNPGAGLRKRSKEVRRELKRGREGRKKGRSAKRALKKGLGRRSWH